MKLSDAALLTLDRLRRGPASTVELQRDLPLVHAPKAIYDLRSAGYRITTRRLPNRVALYRLEGIRFGDPVSIRMARGEVHP